MNIKKKEKEKKVLSFGETTAVRTQLPLESKSNFFLSTNTAKAQTAKATRDSVCCHANMVRRKAVTLH